MYRFLRAGSKGMVRAMPQQAEQRHRQTNGAAVCVRYPLTDIAGGGELRSH